MEFLKIICLLPFVVSLLCGCATKEPSTTVPGEQNGIIEYQQITLDAMAAVKRALQSLDQVAAQASPCPTNIVDGFADEVQSLQVDSTQVRAHAQAIQARGDAYFDNWSENLAHVKDPQVRQRAEQYHPQLQQSFSKIKLTSQEAGAAFRSFFAGLRKLRTSLEKDPGVIGSDSSKDLIRTTRTNGEQVLQLLGSIKAELETMQTMLHGTANVLGAPASRRRVPRFQTAQLAGETPALPVLRCGLLYPALSSRGGEGVVTL
jgi:hypothetical protein